MLAAITPPDGRTRQARFLKGYQRRLLEYIDGPPSTLQAELIRRASRIALHLEMADGRAMAGLDPPLQAQRNYASLNSQLLRCLKALGIRTPTSAARSPVGLADFLSRRAPPPDKGD